jgi:4-hydroxybenzoate polyprenyltransferase
MDSGLEKIKGTLSLVRPDALLGGVVWFFFGYYNAVTTHLPQAPFPPQVSETSIWHMISQFPILSIDFALPALSAAAAVATGLIANQLFDVQVDVENEKPLPLADGSVTLTHAWIEFVALLVIALAIAATISIQYFITLTIAILVGLTYSIPPFRFKARPILDMASFSVTYGLLLFILGWMSKGRSIGVTTVKQAIPYILIAAVIQVITAVEDAPGDAQHGCRTTVVRYGVRNVVLLGNILLTLALLMSVLNRDYVGALIALASLPFAFYTLQNTKRKTVLLLCRVLGILSLGIPFVLFPLFAGLSLLLLMIWGVTRFGSIKDMLLRRR